MFASSIRPYMALSSGLSSKWLDLVFVNSKFDTSLFILCKIGLLLFVLIYVDDILTIGNKLGSISTLIWSLNIDFVVKELGDLHYFLGVKAQSSPNRLFFTHTRNILNLLKKTNMSYAKPVPSLTSLANKLSLFDGTTCSNATLYRSIVGAL